MHAHSSAERDVKMEETNKRTGKDGEQAPGDGDASGKITLGTRECVCGRGSLEEEQCEEDKQLREDAGLVRERVDTECLEGGEENEYGRPAVVQREREVYPNWKGKQQSAEAQAVKGDDTYVRH